MTFAQSLPYKISFEEWQKLKIDFVWIETDSFVHSSSHSTKPDATSGNKGTAHPYVHAPNNTRNRNNPTLSRFEVFLNAQTFCGKPDPLYSTQNSDLFVTYTNGFNLHTGQPNPQSMNNEYTSGEIVLDNSNNKFIFPALNASNIFATIDYDAHQPCFLLYDSTRIKYSSYSL